MNIKILLVEDDAEKARRISLAISGEDLCEIGAITHVTDVHSAKRALGEQRYDLLVLDIAIPPRIDQPVQRDGGLHLLKEMNNRDKLITPTNIVGITAYDDVASAASAAFDNSSVSLIKYDPTGAEWSRSLRARVRHIIAAREDEAKAKLDYGCDLAIVCALDGLELGAVLKNGWTWSQTKLPGDNSIYYRAEIESNGAHKIAYAAAAARMGMPATAVLSTKMILGLRPRHICMTGITAGVQGRVRLGDIIAADPAWDWGSGKWVEKQAEAQFQAAPHQLPLETSLRYKLANFRRDVARLARIREAWPDEKPDHTLSIHVGPLASGASVLADKETAQRIVQQHRQLLGIEMEAYGVLTAADEAPAPRPTAMILKSVVDFADGDKNDRYQRYAAYTSASVMTEFFNESLWKE